jgi:hypothetical protein
MNPIGFVLPAISIGLGALTLRPKRGFFPPAVDGVVELPEVVPQIVLEEVGHDELEITEHPVAQGATIADHAFKRPAEVIIRCAWSDSPSSAAGILNQATGVIAARGGSAIRTAIGIGVTAQSVLGSGAVSSAKYIYDQLLALQSARVPFDVLTGKRAYRDMLFKSITQTTDKNWENALLITVHCRQVIIVSTQTVSSVPARSDAQAFPDKTQATQNMGAQGLQVGTRFQSFGLPQ